MSLNAMANAGLARRSDFPPQNGPPKSATEIAQAAGAGADTTSGIGTALTTITTYIPTEVLTLYVAVTAALQSSPGAGSSSHAAHWMAFWAFLIFTPLAVWAVFAAKVRSHGKELPLNPLTWPRWEIGAGTIPYFAWAFALPGTPFSDWSWYSAAVAGILVLATSTILGMAAQLFQSPLKPTNSTT